jgi:hypothetical protein
MAGVIGRKVEGERGGWCRPKGAAEDNERGQGEEIDESCSHFVNERNGKRA